MRFFEVDSAVDAIMSAALLAQGRASEQNKQGKLSMTGFLQMLANSDVVIDYDGFKNIFDKTPALQNVIAQFNKDTITFKGDSDDEDAGFEPPSGEMPDDERVAKMANRAMKTREFTENNNCGCGKTPCVTYGIQLEKFDPKHGHDSDSHVVKHKDDNDQVFYGVYNADGKITHVFYDEDKAKKFAELNHDDLMNDRFVPDGETPEEEPTGERIKDKKDDEPKSVKMESVLLSKDMREKIAKIIMNRPTKGLVPAIEKYGKKFGDFIQKKMDEGELPPHLAKMFGKDGKQVDTRTDVMKQMRDIVANKQAMKVKFGDGDQMIDMYTASVLTQIYDKVNDNSKEAIIQRIGTKEKFAKLMPKLFGMLGEGKYSKNPAQQAAIAIAKKKAAEAATGVPPEYGRMIVGKGPKLIKKKIGEAWQAVKEMKELYAVYDTANGNRVVATYSSSKEAISGVQTAELPPMSIPNNKTLRIQQTLKQMMIGDKVETKSDMLRKAKKRARAELGMSERSLTKAEKGKMRSYEKKIDKADFIERYGKKEGPGIYYGTITKMAKKNA